MNTAPPVAPPIAPSNLERLDDLAAAAYTVSTPDLVFWEELPESERKRWVNTVAYLLDIVLEPSLHNDHPRLESIRRDAIGARNTAEIELRKAVEHQADMRRIRREVG